MRQLRSLWQLTVFQIRSMMRNKIALFFNFAFPLIFLIVFGFMYGDRPAPIVPVGIADLDGGAAAGGVRQQLAAGRFELSSGTEADLKESLKQGELQAIVLLPQGLSGAVSAGQGAARVPVIYDPSNQASLAAANTLQAVLSGFGARPVLAVEPQALPGVAKVQIFDFLMPGQLGYMLLSAGLVTVAMWLANQRKNGSFRHMFSTPVSVGLWLGSRVAANLLLALVQSLVLYIAAYQIFGVALPANLAGTVLVVAASALATLGLGLAVGVLAPSPEAAMPITMIIFMMTAFLGGSMMPLDGAPAIVQTLAKFVPSTYMNHALRQVMMQGAGLGTVLPDLAVLAVCTLGGLILAAWQMRRQFASA